MANDNGGIIGIINTPTADTASGVWSLDSQYQAQTTGTWPPIPTLGVNSARFNSASSDSLTRTTSGAGTSNQKFTMSLWIKKSSTDSAVRRLIELYNTSSYYVSFRFRDDSSNRLDFYSESNGSSVNLRTNRSFRDLSAWYHLMMVVDTTLATADDRMKMYVNGVQETSFALRTNPGLNENLNFNNSGDGQYIARAVGTETDRMFNGYMSEVNFVDGQALDPTSFGAFNANGVWTPIIPGVTYGNNGFRLKFGNAANLGEDASPNGNNFTVNNLTSVDQSGDYPVNNFATWNAIAAPYSAPTLSEGNTKVTNNAANWQGAIGTFGISQGKWFWEARFDNTTNTYNHGVIDESVNFSAVNPMNATGYTGFYNTDGGEMKKDATDTTADYGTFGTNDIIGIALNMDDKQISIYKNGVSHVSNFALSTTSTLVFPCTVYYTGGIMSYNFGYPPYAVASGNADGNGYGNFEYTVPSGYYSLCTKNLAEFG
jgi:hypothetical protein